MDLIEAALDLILKGQNVHSIFGILLCFITNCFTWITIRLNTSDVLSETSREFWFIA